MATTRRPIAGGPLAQCKPETGDPLYAPTKKTLFPFQERDALWLANQKMGYVGSMMGVGKSATAVRACDLIAASQVLVVCPASLQENWRNEFDTFSHLRIRPSVVSYDKLARAPESFRSVAWDAIICDEAHYLKNPDASRTKAILGRNGVARSAKNVWMLSGTPAPNNAAELWVFLHTAGKTKLTYDAFVERYCDYYQIDRFGRRQITGTKESAIDEIREMLKDIFIRRTIEEVLPDLPEILFDVLPVEKPAFDFPPEVKARFQAEHDLLTERLGLELNAPETDGDMISRLEGLAQSTPTLRRYLGIQKALSTCMTISQELEDRAYDKIVIFAIHREVIEILRAQFPDAAVISGDTPVKDRQEQVNRFQRDPKCRVFIGNIISAGVGFTLTKAHHVIFIELDWVPGNNAQAAARCRRISQLNCVFVRYVTLNGNPLDQKISRAVSRKTAELSQLFDA